MGERRVETRYEKFYEESKAAILLHELRLIEGKMETSSKVLRQILVGNKLTATGGSSLPAISCHKMPIEAFRDSSDMTHAR